jgi:hypothetical protein
VCVCVCVCVRVCVRVRAHGRTCVDSLSMGRECVPQVHQDAAVCGVLQQACQMSPEKHVTRLSCQG